MSVPVPSREPPAEDWQVLHALFSDDESAFRHHMGLVRADTGTFYAPTLTGAGLLAERAAILKAPQAGQYIIATPEDTQALAEFIGIVSPGMMDGDHSSDAGIHRQIGLRLEPDWLLLASPDWRVIAACVCFPTRWSLAGKAMERLANIHGVVPRLNEELGCKIDTFFSKVKTGEGWGRANWGLSSSTGLNQHPSLPYEPLREDHPIDQIQIRVERQHLCKLPETEAMSFGIRVVNYPLAEALAYPAIRAGLRRQLQTMPAEIASYKGIPPDLWQRL